MKNYRGSASLGLEGQKNSPLNTSGVRKNPTVPPCLQRKITAALSCDNGHTRPHLHCFSGAAQKWCTHRSNAGTRTNRTLSVRSFFDGVLRRSHFIATIIALFFPSVKYFSCYFWHFYAVAKQFTSICFMLTRFVIMLTILAIYVNHL